MHSIEATYYVGICGLILSKHCKEIVMTDKDEQVLQLVHKNVALNSNNKSTTATTSSPSSSPFSSTSSNSNPSNIKVQKLAWGVIKDPEKEGFPSGGFDIIIGSDIVYVFAYVWICSGSERCVYLRACVLRACESGILIIVIKCRYSSGSIPLIWNTVASLLSHKQYVLLLLLFLATYSIAVTPCSFYHMLVEIRRLMIKWKFYAKKTSLPVQ